MVAVSGIVVGRWARLLAAGLLLAAALVAVRPTGADALTAQQQQQLSEAQAVFTALNRERAANGRPALRWNNLLVNAAHTHTLAMIRTQTLSHQVAGEASLGSRVTAAGYRWRALAENVGKASYPRYTAMAIQNAFYAERYPNDGHRRVMLSATYRDVGISVVFDAAHGQLWMTEDFGSS